MFSRFTFRDFNPINVAEDESKKADRKYAICKRGKDGELIDLTGGTLRRLTEKQARRAIFAIVVNTKRFTPKKELRDALEDALKDADCLSE